VSKKQFLKVTGFIGTLAAGTALVASAATGTGAYFTDSASGTITGTMGSIAIQGADGNPDNMKISFSNMLPGEPKTQTIRFSNTGANAEDVWLVFEHLSLGDFSKATDDHLINDRGRYAEVHIKSGSTAVFDSANLNDDATSCRPGEGSPACNPLPEMIKLRDNFAPGQTGDFTFSYMPGALYGAKAGEQESEEGIVEVKPLPYKLVATQHGIRPDNALNLPLSW
jgi:hypothetical protein